jgi:autophagy-related protein 9
MMTSNLLSRLLPSNPTGRSIYDDLRAHDAASESDLEERAGLALDEENLGFHDDELGAADVFGEDSRITTGSTTFLPHHQQTPQRGGGNKAGAKSQNARSKWVSQSPRLLEEDPDDDVPASLLIEGNEMPGHSSQNPAKARQTKLNRKQAPIPGPSTREARAHWEAAQAQQRLHQDEGDIPGASRPIRQNVGPVPSQAREKAMWRWINVTNLDTFISEVYDYYTGSGMWSIILGRALTLA